jgi:hypothetical protein
MYLMCNVLSIDIAPAVGDIVKLFHYPGDVQVPTDAIKIDKKLKSTIFVWWIFRLRIWMQWPYYEPAFPTFFFLSYSIAWLISLPVVTDQEWFI